MENHKEVQEVWKELEAARQESEHSIKRLDHIKAGNSQMVEKKEEQGKLAKERSLIRQLELNLESHREAALRQRQAGAKKSQDRVASLGRES